MLACKKNLTGFTIGFPDIQKLAVPFLKAAYFMVIMLDIYIFH